MDDHGGNIDVHLALARPRVVAALTRRFRSLDLAEEAFQEACLRALVRWPETGVPRDPTSWLLVTARNVTVDRLRRDRRLVFEDRPEDFEEARGDPEQDLAEQIDMNELRDDVLRLMFMCCHPDLALRDQLALALKTIAGFSVDKVARAFVVRPKAMEQRITRAKKKAAAIAERLETPSLQERTARLDAVSVMIYLLFNEGYAASGGDVHIREELCDEAIRLLRLLLGLFPSQAEVMGLLALCLFQHSRRRARVKKDGVLVPLEEQDRSLWRRNEIAEGEVLLQKALRHGRAGPYQIQAAIAATHCRARHADETDWREIEQLYAALEQVQPSPVVALNRCVAISKVKDAEAALNHLEGLGDVLSNYLYFHTTRASLLFDVGRHDEAHKAYRHALTMDPSGQEAEHIRKKMHTCRTFQPNITPTQ